MPPNRIKTKSFYLSKRKRRVYRVMEENTAELFFLSKTQAALYVLKLQHMKLTNKKR
jgi:hypothetical protein